MWFNEIEIKNVGPFADFKAEFRRGLVGVFGRNGAGKSTLLDCMYGLVTGDFGRFDGVKNDCVNHNCGGEDESFVRGVVEHNGLYLRITRRFRGKPAAELLVGGDASALTDSRKIAERLHEVLGVTPRALDLFVFKQQHRIYDFLTATDAERKQAFQVLCRTQACEAVWEALGRFVNQDAELNAEFVDDTDKLNAEAAAVEGQLADLAREAAACRKRLLDDAALRRARRAVRLAAKRRRLRRERKAARRELAGLREAAADAGRLLDAARAELRDLEKKCAARKDRAAAARAALAAWSDYAKQRGYRKKLEDALASLTADAGRRTRPEVPGWFDRFDPVQAGRDLASLRDELRHAEQVVETFAETGLVACPTCDTPVASLGGTIDHYRGLVESLPPRIAKLRGRILKAEEVAEGVAGYEKWRAAHEVELNATRRALEALPELARPAGDREDLKRAVAEFEAAEANLAKARRAVARTEARATDAAARASAASERLDAADAVLAGIKVTDERVARARKRLRAHRAASEKLSHAQGKEAGLRQVLARVQEEQARLKAAIRRRKRARKAGKILQRVRDAFHRDALPLRVAQDNVARLEGDVNEWLGRFGDPFWVESSESLQFLVHKPGEPPQNSGRLSTGQKVVLAIAFWFAVASLWKTEVGMLVLDEPTANLDEDNRSFLVKALGSLTGRVRGQRQIVMATHADNLRGSFDQVIEIGA